MLRYGFWVQLEKLVEHVQQGQHMLPVAGVLRFSDIIHNHVRDFFGSMLFGLKITGESRRYNFVHVLVLGYGKHLLFGQAAESDTVLKRDHRF